MYGRGPGVLGEADEVADCAEGLLEHVARDLAVCVDHARQPQRRARVVEDVEVAAREGPGDEEADGVGADVDDGERSGAVLHRSSHLPGDGRVRPARVPAAKPTASEAYW